MIESIALSTIAKRSGGRLKGDARFARVSTDSRCIQKGDLFVALQGEHFDGNQFAGQAADRGAVAAVLSRELNVGIPTLITDDTRYVLGMIGRENRQSFAGPVIAVTGSTGKTTCKDMLACILGQEGNVLCTQGNLNNEIGVPQTLLRLDPHHQFAVIEMGASKLGDIHYLSQLARQDIAIVTNAMPAHIEGFGDLQTVAKTKGELFEALPESGIAVINLDDAFSGQWSQQAVGRRKITFSVHDAPADVVARDSRYLVAGRPEKGMVFTLCAQGKEMEITVPLLGSHNVVNALAAACAALALGVSLTAIQRGLSHIRSVPGRLNVMRGKREACLIDDSYNASPGAVKAAIDVLATFQAKTCLILGNMAELGEQSEAMHREVGCYAKQRGINDIMVAGRWCDAVATGFGSSANCFDHIDDLLARCDQGLDAQVILVKGSRSAGMERVVDMLRENKVVA